MTAEGFSISNNIITISLSVQTIRLLGIIVFAFLLFVIFMRIIMRFIAIEKKRQVPRPQLKRQRKKKIDSHVIVSELHQSLITELRGTSKQNWIMIVLTVVFITVSVFSTIILGFFREIPSFIAPWINSITSMFGK